MNLALVRQAIEKLDFDFHKPYNNYYYDRVTKKIKQYQINNFGKITYFKNKGQKLNRISIQDLQKHILSKDNNNPIKNSDLPLKEKIKINRACKTLGMCAKDESHVVIFDIDDHTNSKTHTKKEIKISKVEAINTLFCLLLEFNFAEPILFEYSIENGGFHIGFQFDHKVITDLIKKFLKYFNKKYDTTLEARTNKKKLRLPHSHSYVPAKVDLTNYKKNYCFEAESIPFESPMDWINYVNNFNKSISVKLLTIGNPKDTKKENIHFRKRNNFETKGKNIYTDFPMSEGNRNENHLALARTCLARKLTIGIFIKASFSNNCGSKDLSSPNAEQLCIAIYNSTKTYFNESAGILYQSEKPTELQINGHLIPKIESKKLTILAKHLLHLSGRKYNKEKYLKAIDILLHEIVGKTIWEIDNPRFIGPKIILTDLKKNKILKGYMFPRKHLTLIEKQFDYKNINIYKLFNFIMYNSNLFTQYKHNKIGYNFGKYSYSRQWVYLHQVNPSTLNESLNFIISLSIKQFNPINSTIYLKDKKIEIRKNIKKYNKVKLLTRYYVPDLKEENKDYQYPLII